LPPGGRGFGDAIGARKFEASDLTNARDAVAASNKQERIARLKQRNQRFQSGTTAE
jgi:hypothetical protein